MKNKFILILFFIIHLDPLWAENLNIESSSISIEKKNKLTIFKDNVIAKDNKNNKFLTDYAEYYKDLNLLISKGDTNLTTSEGFEVIGSNITFDNLKNIIKSSDSAVIIDKEKNKIYLEKFEYSTANKFFKSTGKIKVIDVRNNIYNFSQIYIDEKKREIIGSDIKAFLNDKNFKINDKNKPRVFANTVSIKNTNSEFDKSIFTLCDYRENDKCPPWSVQASNMRHDNKKKTIYYDNALIKVYDIPIFYFPKLSHPDPSVNRRSGFLPPSFTDTKNLGEGISIPYYWNIGKDRDLTFTNKLFLDENPLFLGEYRQAFKNTNLIFDFGYSEGYKNTTDTKKAGSKSHFFSKIINNFQGKNNSDNNLKLTVQKVSDNKHLKLYRIDTNLVKYETDTLENTLDFSHSNEDLFLGFRASAYETLKDTYNDKYEYILPDVVFSKNIFSSDKLGIADFQSNLKIHNYDTNKLAKFFINDINWKAKNFNFESGLTGQFLGKIKNVNYESINISNYKDNTTSELFGALGYLTELDLIKENDLSKHTLTPKILLRYAPGHMRNETNKLRLKHTNVFSLDRLNTANNFENGLSSSIGFDYSFKNNKNEFNFSGGQIINEKENPNMPSSSSLDEKLSDFVGHSEFKMNEKFTLNYDFSLDHNYRNINYNEIGTNIDLNPVKFDFSYLQEKKHIGNQEYFQGNIEFRKGENGIFTAQTKRNLITNSAEFYNLSYEYINDCLRAGVVYRREFYEDSELEAENSLMFRITLTPFGNINSPSFSQ